jgi:hypothetical protein
MDRRSALSRSAQLDLILEALSYARGGLTSREIFEWIRDNRPKTLVQQAEGKLRLKLQQICSTESNKKTPKILKHKISGSRSPSYTWSLPSKRTSTDNLLLVADREAAPESHEREIVLTVAFSLQGEVSEDDSGLQ